jgi:small subunit ribosomal protein S20
LAHTLSAKKRHRQSIKRAERNRSRKTEARSAVRKAREAMATGTPEEAAEAVREAGKILDRVASKGILHRNNARRRKARLAHALNSGGTSAAAEPKKRATRSRAKS